MEDKELTIYEHLNELRNRLIRILIAIGIVSIISLTLSIKEFDLGFALYIPYPEEGNNISMQVIRSFRDNLVPKDVEIIQTSPGQAFFAQLYVSILLGIIISMPVIVRELTAFFAPSLYKSEKRIIISIIIPSIILFIIGILFSYKLIIPFMLDFLYRYGESLGILTFLNIIDLIIFILYFMIAFGLSFQLPVIMHLITKVEMVRPKFWRGNLSYAILIIVIFGAIITPDGSGITMWFISLPMILLYIIGILFVEQRYKTKI